MNGKFYEKLSMKLDKKKMNWIALMNFWFKLREIIWYNCINKCFKDFIKCLIKLH